MHAMSFEPITVLIYSDDRTTREQLRLALGTKVAADLPEIKVVETATAPALLKAARENAADLLVLDGEAVPAGGMGLAHQIKDEIVDPAPIVLLVAREADAWLATWSQAEAVSAYPIDPVRLPRTIAEVIRTHVLPQRRKTAVPAAG